MSGGIVVDADVRVKIASDSRCASCCLVLVFLDAVIFSLYAINYLIISHLYNIFKLIVVSILGFGSQPEEIGQFTYLIEYQR